MCTEHITSLDKIPYKPFRRRGPVPNVPWKIRNSETPSTRVSFRPKNLDFYRQHNSEIHLLPHNSRHKTATGNPQRITTIRKPFLITTARHAIWKTRNQTFYENRLTTPDQVIKSIKRSIKYKNTMESKKTTPIYSDILQMLVEEIEKL